MDKNKTEHTSVLFKVNVPETVIILERLGFEVIFSFYGHRLYHNDKAVISSNYINSKNSKRLIDEGVIEIIDPDYSLKKCIEEKIENVRSLINFLRRRWLWVSDYEDDGYKKAQECLKEYDSFLENSSIPSYALAWDDNEDAARKIRKFFKKYCHKI